MSTDLKGMMVAGQPAGRSGVRVSPEEAGGVFAAAFEATRMPMLITHARAADNPVLFANDAFLELTGYGRDEIVGQNCRFLQGPDTDEGAIAAVREAVRAGRDIAIDILNYRKDGSPFWNALYISPVREGGEIRYFFSSQYDVTAKKRLELDLQDLNARLEDEVERRTSDLRRVIEDRELLLHEVDHRVKNNLQLVASLLAVQTRRVGDPDARETLQRALERVTALSLVHQKFHQAARVGRFDVGGFARQLAEDLLAASGRDDVALEFELEALDIPAAQGTSIALILNELLVNALRHAFPPDHGGKVRLAIKRVDGRFEILVEDDGAGVPGLPPRGGFGTTLVRQLARQLTADLAWEPVRRGTRARLAVSISGDEHHEAVG